MTAAARLIAASRRVHVGQGEHQVSRDPGMMLSTILGSCVAACIRDERSGIGGMNHFLLPEGSGQGDQSRRYGVHLMELLINDILKAGGERGRLRAKLFGGARMFEDLKNIGESNAEFAQRFLRDELIPVDAASLGGRQARRVHYWPATGKVLMRLVEDASGAIHAEERRYAKQAPQQPESGDVELF